MGTNSFEQLWDAIKALDGRQQRRLRKLLRTLDIKRDAPAPQDELNLRLLEDAVLDRTATRLTDAQVRAFDEYKPVPIHGKPLSETVIEERR